MSSAATHTNQDLLASRHQKFGVFEKNELDISTPCSTRIIYGTYKRDPDAEQDFNVIIGPGMHRSHDYFYKLADHFSQAGGQTYCLDWYGQGASIPSHKNQHHLNAYPIKAHADHFRQFLETALEGRQEKPTFLVGHSWGSLPILRSFTEPQAPPLEQSMNCRGLYLFTPFLSMHPGLKKYWLHRAVDIYGQIPGLKSLSIKLKQSGLAEYFFKRAHGQEMFEKIQTKDPTIQELDKDFDKKSFSLEFMREAQIAQKQILGRLEKKPLDVPITIVTAGLETFTCNDTCEHWAQKIGAQYIHLPQATHAGLYDIVDDQLSEDFVDSLIKANFPLPG